MHFKKFYAKLAPNLMQIFPNSTKFNSNLFQIVTNLIQMFSWAVDYILFIKAIIGNFFISILELNQSN